MQTFKRVVLAGTVLLGLIALFSRDTSARQGGFVPRPLINATPEEVAQVALEYTLARFQVISGTAPNPTALPAYP